MHRVGASRILLLFSPFFQLGVFMKWSLQVDDVVSIVTDDVIVV